MDKTSMSSTSSRPFHSVAEILKMLQSVGYCCDLDVSNMDSTGSDSLGCQFDRILSSFFKKFCKKGLIRSLPAMLGDGSPIDLFKFYSTVQREGGYDEVEKECKWKSVAEAMGLDLCIGPSLKLVFHKYCHPLDNCLQILENNQEIREPKRHKNVGTSFVSSSSCKTINYKMVGEALPPLNTNEDQFLTTLVDAKSNAKDVVTLGGCVANGGSNHKKRKKQPLAQMLNWLRKVATNPYHPSLANTLPSNTSKNNSSEVGKLYAQALLATQARSLRRNSRSNPNLLLSQSKAARSNEKLQSERWLSRDLQRAKIPIGAKFQAVIPDWTGRPSIGRGRQNTCQCELPQSAECVRCHIAEKRQQLKRELGRAFHDWGFESMGEAAAFSWTEEEEKKFRDIVFKNQPSLNKNFWDELKLNFPSKTRKSLVSYYFNVFLLGWRRYQNYVTPKNIDSDDEVTEFDVASHSFQNHFCLPNGQNGYT
ncbi:AT-rich interactive domain-containing protein 2-like isoform X2 [Curcuma longa]|uniref:AT-rich interactive domain-containing protein 2-like isoform X2 n=1 Tax=Curcuma longa TaxID=136217 RepID=UPI003D9E6B8A